MNLKPGDKFGDRYTLLLKAGEGGMGEVWKARDTRLDRDVALKVSKAEFTARFDREARSIAALNHSNICTLYDVGPNYLVMELVEGPTLAERIGQGPIPLEESLRIAKQIADALETAHEKGIVHRDLKPANIKIRPDGSVKVLDFGLAKLANEETELTSDSPTKLSVSGMILGTAGYMSPEQARGQKVDKRADIWAFGVVLYEMVTGRRLFERNTVSDMLAAVIKDEPDWTSVPAKVLRLLRRCLEKDPRARLHDIGDAMLLLEDTPQPTAPPSVGPRWLWPAVGALVLLTISTAALAFFEWRRGRQPHMNPEARLTLELTPTGGLGPTTGERFRPARTEIAITPDGSTVVFSGNNPGVVVGPGTPFSLRHLYRRVLDQTESVAIPGTEGAVLPFFSPDGQWVGFWQDGKIKKVSLSGGPVFTLCDSPAAPWGLSWSSTDTIAFAVTNGGDLMQVPASGGTPQVLVKRDLAKGEVYSSPQFLPDGKTLLYTARTSRDWAEAQIIARRLDTGEQRVLIHGGADARYVPTGHLTYLQNGVLVAVPFDARRMQLTGPPVAMLDGVMQAVDAPNSGTETGMGELAVSATGNLVYASGGIFPSPTVTLLHVDRKGSETKFNAPKDVYFHPRISPDGRKLAVTTKSESSPLVDIWVLDLLTGNGTRLTSQGRNSFPLWSLDGKRLLFASGFPSQILSIAADGSGAAKPLFADKVRGIPLSLSVDGTLAFGVDRQIFTMSTSRGGESEPFSDNPKFNFQDGQFSPDGHWMAYVSNETGRNEVWVRAFPVAGEKYRISSDGGINPLWARGQHELFYLAPLPSGNQRMMAVDIAPGTAFKYSQPHQLFEGNYAISTPMGSYDITPDGQSFIMERGVPAPDQPVMKLNVVLNWFDELRRRAPAGKQAPLPVEFSSK